MKRSIFPDLDLKKFKWDIFAALHSKLIEKVESTNFLCEILREEPEASSSSSSSQPSESAAHIDGRLLLGDVLQRIFDEVRISTFRKEVMNDCYEDIKGLL